MPESLWHSISRHFVLDSLNAGTIKTSLEHPVQGKTQMFRRNLDPVQLELVIKQPR